ncbi:MAG: hypothetical protein AAFN74_03145, partial [Myxococcota bacterium]
LFMKGHVSYEQAKAAKTALTRMNAAQLTQLDLQLNNALDRNDDAPTQVATFTALFSNDNPARSALLSTDARLHTITQQLHSMQAIDMNQLRGFEQQLRAFDPARANVLRQINVQIEAALTNVHGGNVDTEPTNLAEAIETLRTNAPRRERLLDKIVQELYMTRTPKDQAIDSFVAHLPNTNDTLQAIETVERQLVNGNGGRGQPGLSVHLHETFFKKKTEIMEHLLEQQVGQMPPGPAANSLQALGRQNYWKALMDRNAHGHNNKHFYDRSRGFMSSMMKGLLHIVSNVNANVDANFISDLHRRATELVTLENADVGRHTITFSNNFSQNSFQRPGFKTSRNSWGDQQDSTPTGLDEVRQLMRDQEAHLGTNENNRFYREEPPTGPQHRWRAGGNRQGDAMQNDVETLIGYVLTRFNGEIAAANNDENLKLNAIIDCCRGLGVIHPFQDANGRVMMILLLNKLLMQNNMPPTILRDQGIMVGMDRTTLAQRIREGQQYLANGGH